MAVVNAAAVCREFMTSDLASPATRNTNRSADQSFSIELAAAAAAAAVQHLVVGADTTSGD